jgi:uncharacterized protein YdaU (DUF1376 family)
MSKPPAFQFYAADFMIGIMGMSDEETGAYIKMLSTQWLHGSLPNCKKTIKKMINLRKVPSEIVMRKFAICDDGFLRNERMETVRQKQIIYAETMKNNANSRWNKKKEADALAMQMHYESICKTDALHSSSSSSTSTSTTILKTNNNKERAEALILPFDSSDFKLFWANWEQHRKEKKAKLTPTVRNQQLAKLKDMGEHRAIAALKHSLANGWTGIYEPAASKPTSTHHDRHANDPDGGVIDFEFAYTP